MNSRPRLRPAHRQIVALLLLMGLVAPAAAQWRLLEASIPGAAEPQDVAMVESPEGHRLQVYRDSANTIRGALLLKSNLQRFAEDSCPTYQIGKKAPLGLAVYNRPCLIQGNRAEFRMGRLADAKVKSLLLMQLINGNNVSFLYELQGLGYARTTFSLRKSKRALYGILGGEVQVVSK